MTNAFTSAFLASDVSDRLIKRIWRSWKKHDRQRAATWSVILSWLSRITPKSDTDVENDTVSSCSSISLMSTFDSCWRVPIQISWVLSVFILSLFACIQPSIASMHSENCRAATDDSEAGTLRCTCISSAYECATNPFLLMTSNSSAVYSRKRRGSRTKPCGTPKTSRWMNDNWLIYSTCCMRPTRNVLIHSSVPPPTPNLIRSRSRRIVWSTESYYYYSLLDGWYRTIISTVISYYIARAN